MAKNTFQFLDVGRFDPSKVDAKERVKGFGEIYGLHLQGEARQ